MNVGSNHWKLLGLVNLFQPLVQKTPKKDIFKLFTWDSATNVMPEHFSMFIKSVIAIYKLRPWDLWIVIAQDSMSGNCFCINFKVPYFHSTCFTYIGITRQLPLFNHINVILALLLGKYENYRYRCFLLHIIYIYIQ